MCLFWKCVTILLFFFTSTWLFFSFWTTNVKITYNNPNQVIPESSWATEISLSLENFFWPFESIIVLSCPFLELSPFRLCRSRWDSKFTCAVIWAFRAYWNLFQLSVLMGSILWMNRNVFAKLNYRNTNLRAKPNTKGTNLGIYLVQRFDTNCQSPPMIHVMSFCGDMLGPQLQPLYTQWTMHRILMHFYGQLMVNWCFGARWFGILGVQQCL